MIICSTSVIILRGHGKANSNIHQSHHLELGVRVTARKYMQLLKAGFLKKKKRSFFRREFWEKQASAFLEILFSMNNNNNFLAPSLVFWGRNKFIPFEPVLKLLCSSKFLIPTFGTSNTWNNHFQLLLGKNISQELGKYCNILGILNMLLL